MQDFIYILLHETTCSQKRGPRGLINPLRAEDIRCRGCNSLNPIHLHSGLQATKPI